MASRFESRVLALLRERHSPPNWGFLAHVPDSTGGARRVCDALAMNLWRSQGMALHGYEIKADRRDWRRELKDPSKADLIAGYCDHFDVVAPPGVVKHKELPPAWGLIEVVTGPDKENPSKLTPTVIAGRTDIRLEHVVHGRGIEAKPLDRGFVAAVFRCVHDQISSEKQISDARYEGYEAGQADGRARSENEAGSWEERCRAVEAKIEKFEELSGINLEYGDPVQLGNAVHLLVRGADRQREMLEQTLANVARVGTELANALTEFPNAVALRGDDGAEDPEA